MPINPSRVPNFTPWSQHAPGLPSYEIASRHYQRYRIPRPPDQSEEGSEPGKICWGTVGAMPSAEPMPTFGFNVKENWKETSRQSEKVRVENPDDPSQYVMEDRPTSVKFDAKDNSGGSGPNTASKEAEGLVELPPVYVTHVHPVVEIERGPRQIIIEYRNAPATPTPTPTPPTTR